MKTIFTLLLLLLGIGVFGQTFYTKEVGYYDSETEETVFNNPKDGEIVIFSFSNRSIIIDRGKETNIYFFYDDSEFIEEDARGYFYDNSTNHIITIDLKYDMVFVTSVEDALTLSYKILKIQN